MKIAILGFGREGKSILKFLQNRGLTRKKTRTDAEISQRRSAFSSPRFRYGEAGQRKSALNEIWILDKNPKSVASIKYPAFAEASAGRQVSGIKTGPNYLKNLQKFDVVFRSPGIPYNLPEIQKAKKAGVEISSATKLFFEQFRRYSQIKTQINADKNISVNQRANLHKSAVIIGITGTKGKGTTSTLLYKILVAAGKKVFLAGNIGVSALELIPRLSASSRRKSAIIILELSSFQLQDIEKSPHIAAVLDIFPDHLDAHKNLEEYYDSKANIGRYQKYGDKVFFFGDSKLSKKIASYGNGKKIAVYPPTKLRTSGKNFNLLSQNDLLIKGAHNFKNAVMAATIAENLGVPEKIILKTVKKFRGLEHRLEFVRAIRRYPQIKTQINADKNIRVNQRKNLRKSALIKFYNDSASHNPTSAAAAVKSFPGKEIILIAGGKDRNLDFSPLADAIRESKTRAVALFGENKKKIEKTIEAARQKMEHATWNKKYKNNELKIKEVKNLEEAVKCAYGLAKKSMVHASRFTILFSPGSASFDMFKNYEERGDAFKKAVKKLK